VGASITISFDKLCDEDRELAISEILACLVSLMEVDKGKYTFVQYSDGKGGRTVEVLALGNSSKSPTH